MDYEMGTQEALDAGCTCRAPHVRPNDIDPPEVERDEWCILHGRDPDFERDRMIDDRLTGDA